MLSSVAKVLGSWLLLAAAAAAAFDGTMIEF
jgi:hypothetical protein